MANKYKVGGITIEDSPEALGKITTAQLTAAAVFIGAYTGSTDLSAGQRQEASNAMAVIRREGAARIADGSVFKT